MALSGLWRERAAHDYTGATKWGNGVDPIHAVRDQGRGRQIGARATLLPLGEPSDAVSEGLTARDIDWVCDDYVDGGAIPGEYYRYQDDLPRWDTTTPEFRGATTSPAMGESESWGPHFDDGTDMFPRPGPTAGTLRWLDDDHGETIEQQHAIAVPTPFVTGGWIGKSRGAEAYPESTQQVGQDRFSWTLNNATVQGPGLQSLDNQRAVQRGTDAPRESILSRTAGMMTKAYARSFAMGGGPGTPDMQPREQTAGFKRPWFPRSPGLPPAEDHMFNTLEGRVPIQRYTAPDPWQGDPEVGAGDTVTDWGY